MAPTRVGIIGTGGMGERHAKGVQQVPSRLRLVAACDIDKQRLHQFGQKFGISELAADWHEVVASREVEAVFVLLPHNLHEEVCVAAARAGKHVLVEKPIARTLEEADRIIRAAEGAGVVLMVAHNQRFYPANRKIRQLLDQGVIGELFCGRIDHHQNFSVSQRSWWRSRDAVGGGCVIGSGIHRLDLLRWYLGEAREVFAFQVDDPRRLEAEVACAATLRFQNGAIAEFFCNWGALRPPATTHEGMSLFGREGCLYFDGAIRVCAPARKDLGGDLVTVPFDEHCESMWEHFADCVNNKLTPLTSGVEGRKSLELVVAIYRSAETGRPVRLPLA
jgi:predicted dehydrogenase